MKKVLVRDALSKHHVINFAED